MAEEGCSWVASLFLKKPKGFPWKSSFKRATPRVNQRIISATELLEDTEEYRKLIYYIWKWEILHVVFWEEVVSRYVGRFHTRNTDAHRWVPLGGCLWGFSDSVRQQHSASDFYQRDTACLSEIGPEIPMWPQDWKRACPVRVYRRARQRISSRVVWGRSWLFEPCSHCVRNAPSSCWTA